MKGGGIQESTPFFSGNLTQDYLKRKLINWGVIKVMTKKRIWIALSVLLVLGLLGGIFGCQQAAPTTTAPAPTTAAPTPTASPAPSPKPTVSPTTAPTTTVAPTPAQPAVITWKAQSSVPMPNQPFSAAAGHTARSSSDARGLGWIEWVQQASGGRLKIDLAPVGTYSTANDAFNAIKNGVFDVAVNHYGAYNVGIVPEANVEVGLPFAWQGHEEAYDAYMNWGLLQKIQAVYTAQGIKWFPVTASTFGTNYMTTFPVNSAADVKGRKIRAVGVTAKYVEAMGGVPVNIAVTDWYMGLKLGTVDGLISGANQLEETKLKEVIKYVVVNPAVSISIASMLISQAKFNALPKDLQDMIQRYTVDVAWAENLAVYVVTQYQVNAAAREYGIKLVTWNDVDTAAAITAGISTWDSVAAISPNVKSLVDIVRTQAKLLGKIK